MNNLWNRIREAIHTWTSPLTQSEEFPIIWEISSDRQLLDVMLKVYNSRNINNQQTALTEQQIKEALGISFEIAYEDACSKLATYEAMKVYDTTGDTSQIFDVYREKFEKEFQHETHIQPPAEDCEEPESDL